MIRHRDERNTGAASDVRDLGAASDVLHLHALKERLDEMLQREGRTHLAEAAFGFLPIRAELDGFQSQLREGVRANINVTTTVPFQLLSSFTESLVVTAEAARENLGVERIDCVADRGYFKIEDIEACEAAGVVAYVAKPIRGSAASQGLFTKEQFRYDAANNVYICPGDARLEPRHKRKVRDNDAMGYVNRAACKICKLRQRCTKTRFRKVTRYANEAIREQVEPALQAIPQVLDQRRESVEHPFGSIKQWMGQGAFLMRRLENVRGEFSLTALAYNLRRAINLVGIPALIAAVGA